MHSVIKCHSLVEHATSAEKKNVLCFEVWNWDYKHMSSVNNWPIHVQGKEVTDIITPENFDLRDFSYVMVVVIILYKVLPLCFTTWPWSYPSVRTADLVLTPASPPRHQPLLQRGQGKGRRSGCRGRGKERRGRGRRVHLASQSGKAGGSLPLLSGAVTGGLSVPATHLPDLWLPFLLHQHLPAQHPARERWDIEACVGKTFWPHLASCNCSWKFLLIFVLLECFFSDLVYVCVYIHI